MVKALSSEPVDDEKPSLRLTDQDLPEIKDWEVDKEYVLQLKVKMTGLDRPDWYKKPKLHGSFRVEAVKAISGDGEGPDDFETGMDSFDNGKADYSKTDKTPPKKS